MKRFISRAFLTLAAVMSMTVTAGAQETETPIITIHSSAYTEVGPSNKFSILLGTRQKAYYDVDMGAGLNEVEIEAANVDPSTGEWTGTWVPLRADANGTIKIYGDPLNLDVLVLEGGYVTDIEMSQCTNLEVISLRHNALQSLDLTPFVNAYAISLNDNPFTATTPLKVGTPKPMLTILECTIIDYMDQSFNLSDYPALQVFDGYHNRGLRTVDPSGCTNLKRLNVELTDVETLDVSKNPELLVLNIGDSRIRNIDLSKNTKLQQFYGDHSSGTINTDIKLENIDLSHNPDLWVVNLSSNNLASVDLSKNPLISQLNLRGNKLTSLDLTANTSLYSVNVMKNDMDYATLPLPRNTWGEYFYLQNDMPVARSLGVGSVLDLSSRVLRANTVTSAKVFRMPYNGEPVELDAALYTYVDGKVTFNEAVADSVYVQFSNDVLADYTLSTTPFLVKKAEDMGKPSLVGSLSMAVPASGTNITFSVGIDGATASAPRTFYIDFGNGNMTEFTSTFSDEASAPNVNIPAPQGFQGLVNIYVAENDVMTSLEVSGLQLYNADVSKATELRRLVLSGCGLYSVDLQYNRCLTYLDLSNNELYSLSIKGVYGNYEKNVLNYIDASHNNIADFEYTDPSPFRHVDLSHNKLTDYNLTNHDYLDYLDLSHNEITHDNYSLAYVTEASYIDLSHNNIGGLRIDKFFRLSHFDISNNSMTIANVPDPATYGAGYVYAPQAKFEISVKAPAINLSSLYREINGQGTQFAWFKTDGTALVNGVDIECDKGGTRFLKTDLGTVYCSMTHPALPQFAGENVYNTTDVTVMGAPTNVIASFTTTENGYGEVIFTGHKPTTLYIDWRGDGTEYKEYPLQTSYISYPGQPTYAGAQVKVYTYDSAEDVSVFSLNDMPMAEIDVTKLTKLINLSINGAKLTADKMHLPESQTTQELSLLGNELTSSALAEKYPNLRSLVLMNNKLTEFDGSAFPTVENIALDNNLLTSVTFNNPALWNLSLTGNQLSNISLQGLPVLSQLFLRNNELSEIDITPVKSTLIALDLAWNRFTFATLPLQSDTRLYVYYYDNQAALQPECIDGTVDLSAVAKVGNTETAYTWYFGKAVYDEENQIWTGETLIPGEEYWMDGGKAIFANPFDEKLMCLMTNSVFPKLTMTTGMILVDESGIENVSVDNTDNETVSVYNMGGMLIRSNVARAEALRDLAPGIYIVGGRKVLVK